MATDATGTPTSPDNIPTYNTAVDAPSGKGFNAAMAAIQAALSSRLSTPAGIAAGEVPIWDGSTWVRSSNSSLRINNAGQALPKVTAGTISAGPPASPTDGDIWIAHDVDAKGTVWQFRYNGASASAYKWEFIGGPLLPFPVNDPNNAMSSQTDTGVNNGVGWRVYVAFASSVSAPRSGDYLITASQLLNTVFASGSVQATVGPATQADVSGNHWNAVSLGTPGTWWNSVSAGPVLFQGLSAGNWMGIGLASDNPGDVHVRWNGGGIIPVRVS